MFKLFNKTKKEPENIGDVLGSLKDVFRELEELKKESRKNLQKVSMVRYNPFPEVGGDQSFSIAVLDADNDGFVITSYYLRESSRVYAKPIEKGASKYQLSKEETEAVDKAIHE